MTQKNKEIDQKLSNKVNLALETVQEVAKQLLRSEAITLPEDIVAKRKKICNMCPELIKGKCSACGCFMNLKTKLSAARCPLGHWDAKIMEEAVTGQMSRIEKVRCCG